MAGTADSIYSKPVPLGSKEPTMPILQKDRFRISIFPISLAGAVSEWFKKDCIGSVTTWEDLVEKFVQKFFQLSNNNEEMEAEDGEDLDDTTEIFKIKSNLYDYETPLCSTFNDFNYLHKIDTNLFTFDIQDIRTYKEYGLNNTLIRDLEELWLDNGVPYQLCDHICEPYHFKNEMTKWPTCSLDIDGFCNSRELPRMVQLINSFENFHELDYNVLVKLQECWWKINAHEFAPFTRSENYDQGPYENAKTKRAYNLYLDINRIFGRNEGADNAGYTQDNQEHKKEHHDPSTYRVRRLEMIKYSFDTNDEYVAIKEHECSEHSETNIDTSLLSNKEKLQELANAPLNENCSAVILKKLPEKLGDPGKFLIQCGFSELKYKALADLGASINLMPLFVWKKLGLPELISTRMTFKLANRAICTPAGIARDVSVPVGKFTFLADFVIVDYDSDTRVPLILGRPFLRTAHALNDVHGEEMILRDEVLMIDYLSIMETDKVIHTVETDIVKLVVEIESFGMSYDEFDKETRSSDGFQPKQADLGYVHALSKLHFHEIHVVPSKHKADQY
nr:reverse transcriptase domain-containing protein [Tanacetum cinerariifolium]